MTRKILIGVFAVIVGISAMLVGGIVWFGIAFDPCDNSIYRVVPSTDGKFKAVIFERSCGATTGFSTQVSLLQADEDLLADGGNILIIDGHPDDAAPEMLWEDTHHLLIFRPLDGREYKAEKIWTNSEDIVRIEYR